MSHKKTKGEAVADRLSAKTPRTQPIPPGDFLSTGCTLLNLAFSGHPDRGVPKGTYLYLVGDSGSMKTWLCLASFAEAARNKNFADYQFVYDGSENGALMDVPRYFGHKVAARIRPPYGTPDAPVYSETVQQFYAHLDLAVRRGPCIYVCDSMDGLNDDADEERFEAEVKKYDTGKGEVPGSMGMAKAKTNSRNINRAVQSLRRTGSILIVVGQTRDKIGGHIPGLKTRGGGRALKFYAHLEAWTSVRGSLSRFQTRNGVRREREFGSRIRIDVQKNRVCGWEGKIDVPFIKGHGIDDVGACVDFLVDEGWWKKAKKSGQNCDRAGDNEGDGGRVSAPEFEFEGTKEELIQKIEADGDEFDLTRLTARVWAEIVSSSTPPRKPRYS